MLYNNLDKTNCWGDYCDLCNFGKLSKHIDSIRHIRGNNKIKKDRENKIYFVANFQRDNDTRSQHIIKKLGYKQRFA